ncbi:MAG: YceH family protein [Pseudomonadaceae bacterium]|nr:YceH family protein [Pseudomonadaceae bacterium]
MPVNLNSHEQRVLGCLLEKAVLTPDQYPLSLNALVNACNQKSSRHPVMALEPGEVQRAIRSLQDKHLLRSDENFKTQVEKYDHRFCNTPFSDYQFSPPQYAIITVLLLRGARTPGELRANSGRLYAFADNEEVVRELEALMNLDKGPCVAQLPRTPGRKDSEYQHLFGDAPDPKPAPAATHPTPVERTTTASENLSQRVAELESALASLTSYVHAKLGRPEDDP